MTNYLEVKNLSKSFDSFQLHNINFTLPKGYIMGLIGPNGSGKTTTIKLILNMLGRNSGEIKIMGLDNITDEQKAKAELGVVFDTNYFSDDWQVTQVEKSISVFYPNWNSERFAEMLRKFHIAPTKKVKELSKGMQMKLMLACAFSYDAKLLILDEPTSGLDPSGAVLFRKIIEQESKKGTTVFVTTHNMVDADLLCDRVAFISNGNLVALDTPKRLKEKNSNHRVVIDYLYQGQRETKTIEAPELEAGIPFAHDEIISIHSQEPTLEDMFIQYTGRGLS